MNNTMQAVWISAFGGPEVLEIRTVGKPLFNDDHVLVRVRASSLNRADLLQRQGKYPPPPGFPAEIPGMEFAGEVAEVGSSVRLWKPGQRVFGLTGGGAHAEYVVTYENLLAEIPANLDWAQAAAVPEVFITAHDALWTQAALRPGETVMVHAVGSGVGLAAVQLARAIQAIPYGTSRTADKIEKAKPLGLEAGLLLRDNFDDLPTATEKWTAGKGINVLLDLVGGPYVKASQKAMAHKGRMILVGTVAGGSYELDARYVMSKRLQIRGTVLRARSMEEKMAATRLFAAEVVPLLALGVLRPNVDSVFPLAEISQAHQRLESNETFGKVVVVME
ncbi:MAG TPA: NAD(P)H-quinone oxidoreductase [Candidatus Angelobacter sp.]|jgi:putative PIG3 family NAD(P)H quinone oxidoreductase|nr:NAD(P)H-quinone oxidoreductase [Candidatus Angelobacter sp.]